MGVEEGYHGGFQVTANVWVTVPVVIMSKNRLLWMVCTYRLQQRSVNSGPADTRVQASLL